MWEDYADQDSDYCDDDFRFEDDIDYPDYADTDVDYGDEHTVMEDQHLDGSYEQ